MEAGINLCADLCGLDNWDSLRDGQSCTVRLHSHFLTEAYPCPPSAGANQVGPEAVHACSLRKRRMPGSLPAYRMSTLWYYGIGISRFNLYFFLFSGYCILCVTVQVFENDSNKSKFDSGGN
jgi:hypothetical protein